MRTVHRLLATAVAVSVVSTPVFAQNVARVYVVEPEPGFATAFGAHMEWRSAQGDPWTWTTYQAVMGDNIGRFMIRSGGHTWADFDAYDTGFGASSGDHFGATVLPVIGSVNARTNVTDTAHTRLPGNAFTIEIVSVATLFFEPGEQAEFMAALGRFHAAMVKHDVPIYYAVNSSAAGGPGPSMNFITLHPNWESFGSGNDAIGPALVQEYGADGATEIQEQVGRAIRSVENTVWVRRPDLSISPN